MLSWCVGVWPTSFPDRAASSPAPHHHRAWSDTTAGTNSAVLTPPRQRPPSWGGGGRHLGLSSAQPVGAQCMRTRARARARGAGGKSELGAVGAVGEWLAAVPGPLRRPDAAATHIRWCVPAPASTPGDETAWVRHVFARRGILGEVSCRGCARRGRRRGNSSGPAARRDSRWPNGRASSTRPSGSSIPAVSSPAASARAATRRW